MSYLYEMVSGWSVEASCEVNDSMTYCVYRLILMLVICNVQPL